MLLSGTDLIVLCGWDPILMVYPLVDVAIIVLKSQDGASEQGKNDEIGQIIKAMKLKYGNLGYSNRKLPILLLLNQVDQMVFDRPEDENEEEEGSSDETLKQKFEHDKLDIFKNLEAAYVGFDKEKIQYLFTSFRPSFPQPPPEKAEQWLKELCNNNITAYEYNKRMRCGGKKRLQQITGCSFFKFEAEAEQNDESIVNVLAKIVENLGDKDEANAMRAMFDDRDDVVVVNNPEQWPDFGCEGIKVQRAHQPTSQCQGKKNCDLVECLLHRVGLEEFYHTNRFLAVYLIHCDQFFHRWFLLHITCLRFAIHGAGAWRFTITDGTTKPVLIKAIFWMLKNQIEEQVNDWMQNQYFLMVLRHKR
eukprot:TRINITY_DN6552_c0_g1_i4.p2 TRINITY_DN6552_c0_g1~~TRINITY_DN6552_c0_g1_i4.p2  ORF type:complete len:362 (-),score=68.62 TRINITY_DN6552_c0_g1_i4:242-1327(-)